MNVLGFKSAIYTLANAGDAAAPAMLETGENLARSVGAKATSGAALDHVEQFVGGVAAVRGQYAGIIDDAARGTETTESLATRFGTLARQLDGVYALGVSGAPQGHVLAARSAADDVSNALQQAGIRADGAVPEATHMRIWDLRFNLDQAMHEIGMGKVLGTLR